MEEAKIPGYCPFEIRINYEILFECKGNRISPMLSRVADSLFWMSRYIERTDGILRMLKINYASSQDNTSEFTWKPVLKIFTFLEESEMAKLENNSRAVLHYMVVDKENP